MDVRVDKSDLIGFQGFLDEIRTNQANPNRSYLPPQYFDDIYDYYESTKQAQGFIGKTWDKIKNKLNFKSGSKNVENILENLKNDRYNEMNEDEAIRAVNKYAKSQLASGVFARNTTATMVAGLAALLAKLATKNAKGSNTQLLVGFAAAVVFGAIGAVAIKAADAKSANRKYSKGELANDLVQGGVQGAITGLAPVGADVETVRGSKLFTSLMRRFGTKKHAPWIIDNAAKVLANKISKAFITILMSISATSVEVRSKWLYRYTDSWLKRPLQPKKSKVAKNKEKYEKHVYFDPRTQKAA